MYTYTRTDQSTQIYYLPYLLENNDWPKSKGYIYFLNLKFYYHFWKTRILGETGDSSTGTKINKMTLGHFIAPEHNKVLK